LPYFPFTCSNTFAGLRDPTSKWRGEEGKGNPWGREEERRGNGDQGRGGSGVAGLPFTNSWIRPYYRMEEPGKFLCIYLSTHCSSTAI